MSAKTRFTIGIDASRANAEHPTGTEWYAYHVIQGLKKRIPDTYTVVLYSSEPLRGALAELPAHWQSRVLSWPPRFLWTQLRLSAELFFHRPDLLYIPAHTIPLIHPRHTIAVVHDVGFERQEELYGKTAIGYNNRFAKYLMNFFVRLATLGKYGATEYDYHRFSFQMALRHATTIITVSEFSKREMQEIYTIPSNRIQVIPNGLNDRISSTHTSDILDRFHIREPYVLFIGRIEQKKNIPRLIDAFALLHKNNGFSGQLVLCGSPGHGYEEVQERIAKHKLGSSVVETGWTTEEDLSLLLERASLFVFPSLYEGFGIPILEAMQTKIPVVCADIPALREVGGLAPYYVNPYQPEDIAKGIETVMTNDGLRDTLIAYGEERVQLFSWEKTAQDTWNILYEYCQE